MSANGIAQLATREARQKAKLDLAAAKRAADVANRDNPTNASLRSTYDITELPTQFNDNDIIDNPNLTGLIVGRPWINAVADFTFFEAFGTTLALETTQYVSGNKIYAYSSSFDVPGYQNARVVVNDIEVLNVGTGRRGHSLVILDTYGNVVSTATYDTYLVPSDLTALASALNGVASGNIVVLVVFDASALDSTVRSAINAYGSTNSNTWTASRRDHIFIGIKP